MLLPATAFLIVLAGSFAQAVTGFGFALLAVPLLALATDAPTAVVGASIAGLLLTATMAVRERAHVRWRAAGVLLAAAVVGMPLGLVALHELAERVLAALIAVVAIGCTLVVWRRPRLPDHPAAVGGAGLLAGVLGAATGMNGPPLVAAFQSMAYQPRPFRATLAAVFAGTGTVSLAGYALTGELTRRAGAVGLAGLPAILLGWAAGNRVFLRVEAAWFRRAVLTGLLLSSAATLVHALVA
jgi:uncharacterized protein